MKAIAQAITTYAMSCFDITTSLCDEISTIADSGGRNKIMRRKCIGSLGNVYVRGKIEGGLGYRLAPIQPGNASKTRLASANEPGFFVCPGLKSEIFS